MKITKTGTVTISEGSVIVSGFEFDCEGSEFHPKDAAITAINWATRMVAKELADSEVTVGSDNTINGRLLLPV